MAQKTKYRLRAVSKTDDEGFRRWRIELWQFHTGWLDALQGWFDDEAAAKAHINQMNG